MSFALTFAVYLSSVSRVHATEKCGDVEISAWTSDTYKSNGYHVLCIDRHANSCSGNDAADETGTCSADGADGTVKIKSFWNGFSGHTVTGGPSKFSMSAPKKLYELETAILERQSSGNPKRYERIKKALEKKGTWKGMYGYFAIDPTSGMPSRVRSPEGLTGLVLVFEGGQFIWPGIKVGFERNITLNDKGSDPLHVTLLTRSFQPAIYEVSSFVGPDECQHVIKKAEPHIAKSAVKHMDHDVGKPDTNWRTSSTYFAPSDTEVMRRLDRRVGKLTLTKVRQQENAQILRYENGEKYAAHHDYFDPRMYQSDSAIVGMTKKGLFNRLITVFFYLSDVEDGGETGFLRGGGLPPPRNFDDCSRGIRVQPKEGRIIIFYSQDAAGNLDEYSLHSGCVVKNGTKWSANKWIWNKDMNYLDHSNE